MTKTQQNRITISIMNLWANRIGQLTTLAVALFFFSCEEETSTLGYKNPNSKFKVSYVEIPIESSVILRDSLRTSNFAYSGEPNRLMVGSYTDEVFGQIEASSITPILCDEPTIQGKLNCGLRFRHLATSVRPVSLWIYVGDASNYFDL